MRLNRPTLSGYGGSFSYFTTKANLLVVATSFSLALGPIETARAGGSPGSMR
jgi:hypothetical protein